LFFRKKSIVIPPTIDGKTYGFTWKALINAPYTAAIILLLLWVAIKAIRGKSNGLAILAITGVVGIWFTFGHLVKKITYGFSIYTSDFNILVQAVLDDLTLYAILTGVALILFNHTEATQAGDKETSRKGEMSLGHLLFSFNGRISRVKVWIYKVLYLDLLFVACIAMVISFGKGREGALAMPYIFLILLTFWPNLALAVKRCHDRNKSGWFFLVSLVPIVSLWYVVEIFFLPGTEGDNQYGPNPLYAKWTSIS
jgi:uncharacterized membrane protein YhaH (DUF805 family)